jgi:integrase
MWFRRKLDRTGAERYVFVFPTGSKKPLPRKLTKHLDGQPDHNIKFWMAEWAAKHGHALPRTGLAHPGLRRLLDDYKAWLVAERAHRKTVRQHYQLLEQYVLPTLLSLDPQNTDPNHWPRWAPKLRDALADAGCSDNTIRLANVALRGLWAYLARGGQVLHVGLTLLLLNPTKGRQRTPLQRVVTPDDVLAFAQGGAPATARLMALMAYFWSLRPQEVFALERRHFRGGTRAASLEAVKVMKGNGLGYQLAYYVERQRDERGEPAPPKELSVGWVVGFDDWAAPLVVQLLAEHPQTGWILPATGDHYYRYWRRCTKDTVLAGVSLKDLRRASLYYLGHHTSLPPAALQAHARHADAESTSWYLRRPSEAADDALDSLVLDAKPEPEAG